jgi:hypothetical protein
LSRVASRAAWQSAEGENKQPEKLPQRAGTFPEWIHSMLVAVSCGFAPIHNRSPGMNNE